MHIEKSTVVIMRYTVLLLLLLLFSCLCLLSGVNAQDDCELTGFSLTDLSKPAWWKLALTNHSGCIFAVTDGIFQHSDCNFYFSICHGLRELTECNTNGNWSVCQKGTFNNQPMSASIANYKPINESGTELTESGQHGFRVFYAIDTAYSDLCQNVTVNLTFLCDQTATWPSTEGGGEAPNGLDTYSFIYSFVDKICKYSATFKYNGACYMGPTLGPTLCYISEYNFQFLSQKDYWEFDESDEKFCLSKENCHFFFRVCEVLPEEINSNCGKSSGVCINRNGIHYNLGNYNNTYDDLRPREDIHGFVANYTGGDPAFLGCSSGSVMTTTLNFICSYTAVWSNDSNSALKPYDVKYDVGKCTAEFFFMYSGACIAENSFNVPVLFLFVVFIFIIFVFYWIFGFAINIGFGKRGKEAIPNKSFWFELVHMFAGGFIFLFRLITCRSKDSVEKTEDEEPIVTKERKEGYQTIENAKYPFGP